MKAIKNLSSRTQIVVLTIAIIAAIVFGIAIRPILFAGPGREPTPAVMTPTRPYHNVDFDTELGKKLNQVEADLGITSGKVSTALKQPVLVAVPTGFTIDNLAPDQLVVTAICVDAPTPDAATPYPVYFGVTPSNSFTPDMATTTKYANDYPNQLRQSAHCGVLRMTGVSVYDD